MTPSALGYTMPPEWAPHRGTWLSWPHRESSWPGKFEPVPRVFAEMVRLLSPYEEVHINVTGQEMEAIVRDLLIAHDIDPSVIARAAEPLSSSTTTPPTTPGAATTAPVSSSAAWMAGARRPLWTGGTTRGAGNIRRSKMTT